MADNTTGLLARVLVYGDIHLHSKNYGAHRDYPKESLEYFKNITNTAKEIEATHIIGLGDFSYGRFATLEYRQEVQEELKKQYELTHGNRWELKGNHDASTRGMTEYEFYVSQGLLRPSENITIGNVNISMVDYGKHDTTEILADPSMTNIVCAHDYFKFSDTPMPNYGNPIILDYYAKWVNVQYLICGHIHEHNMFTGKISDNHIAKEMIVHYLGCPCRPSYHSEGMQDTGHYSIIDIFENKEKAAAYNVHEFPLYSIDKSFCLEEMDTAASLAAKKTVDISDVVKRLDQHERVLGDPEALILSMTDIKEEYKQKAIQLLHDAEQ